MNAKATTDYVANAIRTVQAASQRSRSGSESSIVVVDDHMSVSVEASNESDDDPLDADFDPSVIFLF